MKLLKTAAVLAAAATLVTLAACKPAAPSAQDIEAAKAVNGAWIEQYNAGNADAVADLYWEDASFLEPGRPAHVGRDAIRAAIAAGIEAAKSAGLTNTNEDGPVQISGNIAWQQGTYKVTNAAGATLETGKYLSVLEKRGDQWRLLRDTYNSDGAPPAAAAGPDPIAVDPAHYKVAFENDKVRVLRITYGPKEKSVMHSHPEGVVVFLNDINGRFKMPDGSTRDMQVKAGTVSWTDAETHEPENLGNKPFEVIQVELK
jgi:uncharacterized protein (TIGR02246 family)